MRNNADPAAGQELGELGPEAPQLAGATDYGVASRANASGAVWSNWVSLGGNTKAFAC